MIANADVNKFMKCEYFWEFETFKVCGFIKHPFNWNYAIFWWLKRTHIQLIVMKYLRWFFSENAGVKAVIIYTYDDSVSGSSVVSMEVDKNTFMSVIKDSQFSTKAAKPLKFAEDNGFFALLEGESSSFSFATSSGMADCDCKCAKKIVTTTTTTTLRPTTTTTTTHRPTTTTTTHRTTTTTTHKVPSTPGSGYLPPTTTPNPVSLNLILLVLCGQRKKYLKLAKHFRYFFYKNIRSWRFTNSSLQIFSVSIRRKW